MTKLSIPLSPQLGSPLTDEELKSIIGGQTDASRSCHCTFYYEGGGTGSSTTEADSESVCEKACEAACSKSGSCISAKYFYSAEG